MSKRDWIEVGVSLLSGAGIGAGLMYLFDPEAGEERRERAKAAAGEYAASTGEALGAGWEHLSEGAQSLASKAKGLAGTVGEAVSDHAHTVAKHSRKFGNSLADHASSLWSSGTSKASDYADATGDFLGDARDTAAGWGRSAAKSVRSYTRGAGKKLEREHHSALGLTVGALGALALGAGVMFLLDPAQGRRRRAIIRDRTVSAANSTARYAQSTGRHIANKATGMAHSVGDYAAQAASSVKGLVSGNGKEPVDDHTLAETVKAAVGKIQAANGVTARVEQGRVVLTGMIPASGLEGLVAAVRGIHGVAGVDNRLDVRDSVASA